MHCLANLTASPGDTGLTNDNQIGLAVTAGLVANNNDFFDRLEPIAVNDTNSAVYFAPTNIYPLINDTNFNGDALTITNAVATGGFVTIDAGGTNIIGSSRQVCCGRRMNGLRWNRPRRSGTVGPTPTSLAYVSLQVSPVGRVLAKSKACLQGVQRVEWGHVAKPALSRLRDSQDLSLCQNRICQGSHLVHGAPGDRAGMLSAL